MEPHMSDRIPMPPLLGGRLCLDFCNTAEFRDSERYVELLTSYPALIAWSKHAGTISAGEAEHLLKVVSGERAAAALDDALALRLALYRLFRGCAHGEPADLSALDMLNTRLSGVMALRHLQPLDSGFYWEWGGSMDDPQRPLWPVLLSASELMTSDDLRRVRQCPNCGWLFVDTSRNHTRRWCSMDFCGSEVKSRRQYQRKRASREQVST
jgi:predicted RNA-binding Zn ribbon-like protein